MNKMCGFRNVLHICQKHEPSESVREQESDINNELQHGNIFMHNGNSQERFLRLCKNQNEKKKFVFLDWKAT